MKKNNCLKAVVCGLVLLFLVASSAQAIRSLQLKQQDTHLQNEGWYWKASYPNYAPKGMPDFDQQQDRWKKMTPGPNGQINSPVLGDDIYNAQENCIAPGPDCYLNSTIVGDDVEEWIFCGPVTVANCFWWFDSQYADPTGAPGDGQDHFSLVEDYGAGDDHATANAPLLIEELARAMNTTEKGTTYITDMQAAIDLWFTDTELDDKFIETTYQQPTFDFIKQEIERSQDVILLLGSYDYVLGEKIIDQQQPIGMLNDWLNFPTWWDFQSFTPTVNRLDAIQILIVSNGPPCDLTIDVYNVFQGNAIASSTLNPGFLQTPTWVQFHFDPFVPLTPGALYYFDVHQPDSNYHYEWFFAFPNPYPGGQGWMNTLPVDPQANPFDWAFKTEYYNPETVQREGHFVTCAGVNSENLQIAFSDPTLDVANVTQSDHNDAQNVSHDIYNVSIGSPRPDINCTWWLTDYPSPYDYTVVEQAVVICPQPDTTPPTGSITKPENAFYFFSNKWFDFPVPVMIGFIDVEVNASDDESGVNRVEFYLDNQLKANDTDVPYLWTWNENAFFVYMLKVIIYDNAGNSADQEMRVWKFF